MTDHADDAVRLTDPRHGHHDTDLGRLLRHELPAAYERACHLAESGWATRGDPGRGRAGKPASAPPRGGDRDAALAALQAARAIVDACRVAGCPWEPWPRPTVDGSSVDRRRRDAVERPAGVSVHARREGRGAAETVYVEVDDVGSWPYPDDLAPLPWGIEEACGTLARRLEALGRDEPERKRARWHAVQAGQTLYRVGVLAPPCPPVLCANLVNGCANPPRPGKSRCGTCQNFRTRHGRDRVVEDGRAVRAG